MRRSVWVLLNNDINFPTCVFNIFLLCSNLFISLSLTCCLDLILFNLRILSIYSIPSHLFYLPCYLFGNLFSIICSLVIISLGFSCRLICFLLGSFRIYNSCFSISFTHDCIFLYLCNSFFFKPLCSFLSVNSIFFCLLSSFFFSLLDFFCFPLLFFFSFSGLSHNSFSIFLLPLHSFNCLSLFFFQIKLFLLYVLIFNSWHCYWTIIVLRFRCICIRGYIIVQSTSDIFLCSRSETNLNQPMCW